MFDCRYNTQNSLLLPSGSSFTILLKCAFLIHTNPRILFILSTIKFTKIYIQHHIVSIIIIFIKIPFSSVKYKSGKICPIYACLHSEILKKKQTVFFPFSCMERCI